MPTLWPSLTLRAGHRPQVPASPLLITLYSQRETIREAGGGRTWPEAGLLHVWEASSAGLQEAAAMFTRWGGRLAQGTRTGREAAERRPLHAPGHRWAGQKAPPGEGGLVCRKRFLFSTGNQSPQRQAPHRTSAAENTRFLTGSARDDPRKRTGAHHTWVFTPGRGAAHLGQP